MRIGDTATSMLWYTLGKVNEPVGRRARSAASFLRSAGRPERFADLQGIGEFEMAQRKQSRNEKIFYVVSLLIIISMILGSLAVVVAPNF